MDILLFFIYIYTYIYNESCIRIYMHTVHFCIIDNFNKFNKNFSQMYNFL